ncbi:hypothetical protein BDQ12DRAFT_723469 [Crucibulum laeve]|uniref:F-box domain-containing protein n=1 Tax=Crucibulum laeve TaxID=68775 RepID=A0A5C3M1A6_9AGAR|nr:hypothetical protein BDQ12DRAFT_723469 [Crucibulum laeve]
MNTPRRMTSLPPELVAIIIDYLDGDTETLAACSTFSRDFLHAHQRQLFHTVYLAYRSEKDTLSFDLHAKIWEFADLLRESPRLAKYVKKLYLNAYSPSKAHVKLETLDKDTLLLILPMLSELQELSLGHGDWQLVSSPLQVAFTTIFKSKVLRSLHLEKMDVPASFFDEFHCLKELAVSRYTAIGRHPHARDGRIKLESLTSFNNMDMLELLLDSQSPLSIKGARVFHWRGRDFDVKHIPTVEDALYDCCASLEELTLPYPVSGGLPPDEILDISFLTALKSIKLTSRGTFSNCRRQQDDPRFPSLIAQLPEFASHLEKIVLILYIPPWGRLIPPDLTAVDQVLLTTNWARLRHIEIIIHEPLSEDDMDADVVNILYNAMPVLWAHSTLQTNFCCRSRVHTYSLICSNYCY